MKYRTDFVTNSSSSSFIIGKKDEGKIDVEYVYQLIRELYVNYLAKRDALVEYIKDNPKLHLEYVQSNVSSSYYHFKYTDGSAYDNKHKSINGWIEREFGISIFDSFPKTYEWLKCKTYEEYAKYWQNRMENGTWSDCGPFTIADFLDSKPIEWLHFKSSNKNIEMHTINSKSDVLLWYFEDANASFADEECSSCRNRRFCESKEECEKLKKRIKDEKIPEDHACLYLLGRVCIYSECGYIPDTIVAQLYALSEFACNHMG